jgi:hypothetical protein
MQKYSGSFSEVGNSLIIMIRPGESFTYSIGPAEAEAFIGRALLQRSDNLQTWDTLLEIVGTEGTPVETVATGTIVNESNIVQHYRVRVDEFQDEVIDPPLTQSDDLEYELAQVASELVHDVGFGYGKFIRKADGRVLGEFDEDGLVVPALKVGGLQVGGIGQPGALPIITSAAAPVDSVAASLLVNPAGDDNAILYTAVTPGDAGNAITITYAVPEDNDEAVPLSVAVDGTDIVITLEVDTDGSTILTTAADVIDAIETPTGAWADVAAMVSAALDDTDVGNDGTGLLAAFAEDALEGGVDGTGQGQVDKGWLLIDLDTPRRRSTRTSAMDSRNG